MFSPGKVIQPSDLRFEKPLRPDPFTALPDPADGFKVNEFLDLLKCFG